MTKEEFVRFENNWDSHRPLLWEALEATEGEVLEFGAGMGSTPRLLDYCFEKGRNFESYESSQEWADKMCEYPVSYISNWDDLLLGFVGLLFIDHAPGERRKVDIARWANHTKIIVAHDTEPAADHGYQMRAELKKFKYMIDYETDGAWASAVSNFIDVTKWKPWRKEN